MQGRKLLLLSVVIGELAPYSPKIPLSEVGGHPGITATGLGRSEAASGGKCCHKVTVGMASSSAHACCGCGPHLA